MNNQNYPPFHLSISPTGLVSLWDNEASARGVSADIYVRLDLTPEQVVQLDRAKNAGRILREHKEAR